jgi:hypothetical protein
LCSGCFTAYVVVEETPKSHPRLVERPAGGRGGMHALEAELRDGAVYVALRPERCERVPITLVEREELRITDTSTTADFILGGFGITALGAGATLLAVSQSDANQAESCGGNAGGEPFCNKSADGQVAAGASLLVIGGLTTAVVAFSLAGMYRTAHVIDTKTVEREGPPLPAEPCRVSIVDVDLILRIRGTELARAKTAADGTAILRVDVGSLVPGRTMAELVAGEQRVAIDLAPLLPPEPAPEPNPAPESEPDPDPDPDPESDPDANPDLDPDPEPAPTSPPAAE